MGRIIDWMKEHNTEISWWIVGWMCFAALDSFFRGNYVFAAIDAGLAYLNYRLWKSVQ